MEERLIGIAGKRTVDEVKSKRWISEFWKKQGQELSTSSSNNFLTL